MSAAKHLPLRVAEQTPSRIETASGHRIGVDWSDQQADNPYQEAEEFAAFIVRACNAHDELLAALKHQIANCPLCKGTGVADQLEVLGYQRMEFQEGDCRRCADERVLIIRIESCPHTLSKAERNHG